MATKPSKYVFGGRTFRTKRLLTKEVQTILNSGPLGPVSESDRCLLIDLFRVHPGFHRKVKEDEFIIEIEKRNNEFDYSSRTFYAILSSGESIDFSYIKCIRNCGTGKNRNFTYKRNLLERVLREVAQQSINEFRRSHPKGKCEKCNKKTDLQVDHHSDQMPFRQIVKDFLKEEKRDVMSIEFKSKPNGIGSMFVDDQLSSKFEEFHRKNAILRYLCITCNTSAPKKNMKNKNE